MTAQKKAGAGIVVGVLAVQGAFIEHERRLEALSATCIELRRGSDVHRNFDCLVLPGGESTVQSKLLHELDMFDTLKEYIENGMPTLGTCAGMILLAHSSEIEGFDTLPITIERNAYGRQLGSFTACSDQGAPLTFIRAPRISSMAEGVEMLASYNNYPVAVRFANQLACAFHPELDDNPWLHKLLLSLVRK